MLIQPRLAVVYQEFYHGCENSVYPEATRGKLQIFTTVVKSGIPRLAVVELIYLIARRKAFSSTHVCITSYNTRRFTTTFWRKLWYTRCFSWYMRWKTWYTSDVSWTRGIRELKAWYNGLTSVEPVVYQDLRHRSLPLARTTLSSLLWDNRISTMIARFTRTVTYYPRTLV